MEEIKLPLKFLKKDFKNEADMCDYIEWNIKLFCIQCLGVTYKSHTREYAVRSNRRKSKRLDFLIVDKSNNLIIVECKHPIHICELHAAVGQVLSYASLLKASTGKEAKKLAIVSSKFDSEVLLTIKQFNLPITLVGLDKSHHLLHDISHLN